MFLYSAFIANVDIQVRQRVCDAAFEGDFKTVTSKWPIWANDNDEIIHQVMKSAILGKNPTQMVEYLLLNHIPRSKVSDEIDDGLLLAVDENQLEVIKILIDHGANHRIRNDLPLKRAVERGHLEVIRYLVGLGANPHGAPLIDAIWKKQLKVVIYLVEELGTDIHILDDYPLQMAVTGGCLPIISYLIDRGACLTSVLPRAITATSIPILRFLLSRGANITAQNDQALRLALSYDDQKMTDFLLMVYPIEPDQEGPSRFRHITFSDQDDTSYLEPDSRCGRRFLAYLKDPLQTKREIFRHFQLSFINSLEALSPRLWGTDLGPALIEQLASILTSQYISIRP